MTTCTTGPNGGRCASGLAWDEAMRWVLLSEQEHEIAVGLAKARAEYHQKVAQMRKEEIAELRKRVASAEQAMRCAQGEHANTKFWKRQMHDSMQSTIARETRRANVAEAKYLLLRADMREAIDALRNVLGRTIEMRVDPSGRPLAHLGEERNSALALAGEVMKGVRT